MRGVESVRGGGPAAVAARGWAPPAWMGAALHRAASALHRGGAALLRLGLAFVTALVAAGAARFPRRVSPSPILGRAPG